MDAAAALERLREISSQVRAAVIFERGGKVVGSTFADDQRAKDVAEEAEALLTEAEQRRNAGGEAAEFAQLEVALQGGSVFYDLKSCLRDLDTAAPPKKRAAPRRKPASRAKKTDAKS